jgi:hypothetical protein
MTGAFSRHLIELLQHPAGGAKLAPPGWVQLLSVARAANLLATLGERLTQSGVAVPPAVQRHLVGATRLSARQHESVRWEAYQLARALEHLKIPVLLLKGSAYVLGALPVSRGRLFGDIDILVPRSALGQVEVAMMTKGWTSAKHDEYDQRYYRQWMHELPPMVNVRRGTVLDIHHTLLPLTSRHVPDPQKLIDASHALPGLEPLRIPAPQDLVIHSITHLFHEGELHNGLRDLFDIDGLLRHFAATRPDFWVTLLDRAEQLQLGYPLFLGLHFAMRILGTPVPATIIETASKRWAPATTRLTMLEWLYDKGLQPIHPDCADQFSPLARWLLYVRAHWLRMPPHLLARHLSRKTLKILFPYKSKSIGETEPGALP